MSSQQGPRIRGKLRTRIRLFGFLLVLSIAIFSFIFTHTMVRDRALQLEEKQVDSSIQRALAAVNREIYQLEVVASDLSAWDDIYAFADNPSGPFTEKYLANEYFYQSGVNLVMILDSSKQVLFSRAVDLNKHEEIPMEAGQNLEDLLKPIPENGLEDAVSGMLAGPEVPMFITYQPVLTSEGAGPSRGTLIMGRFIDSSVILKLESDLQMPLAIDAAGAMALPEDFQAGSEVNATVVEPLDGSTVAGYMLLADAYNSQSIVLRVELPRDIYNANIQNAAFISAAVIVLVMCVLVFMIWIFDRTVLKRLAFIDRFVRKYEVTNEPVSQQMQPTGNDELTRLSLSINGMVSRLSESHREIRKTAEENLKLSEQTRKLYEEEKRTRQELQEEIDKRIELTKALGHEIKTPVTPILASIDLLKNQIQDEKAQGLIRIISRSASNLNKRMDDFLDLAKAEVNMLNLNIAKVNLVKILEEVTRSMEPVAVGSRQKIITDIPPELPVLFTDSDRFQRTIENLMGNALKYTPTGGSVFLTARVENDKIVIEVRDTGIGISDEDLQWLFQPYHRQTGSRERLGGLGMSLALSKKFLELQGGDIQVRSEAGKGSTFSVSLPLRASADVNGPGKAA